MWKALVVVMVLCATMAGACSHPGPSPASSGHLIAEATFETSHGRVPTSFLDVANTEAESAAATLDNVIDESAALVVSSSSQDHASGNLSQDAGLVRSEHMCRHETRRG